MKLANANASLRQICKLYHSAAHVASQQMQEAVKASSGAAAAQLPRKVRADPSQHGTRLGMRQRGGGTFAACATTRCCCFCCCRAGRAARKGVVLTPIDWELANSDDDMAACLTGLKGRKQIWCVRTRSLEILDADCTDASGCDPTRRPDRDHILLAKLSSSERSIDPGSAPLLPHPCVRCVRMNSLAFACEFVRACSLIYSNSTGTELRQSDRTMHGSWIVCPCDVRVDTHRCSSAYTHARMHARTCMAASMHACMHDDKPRTHAPHILHIRTTHPFHHRPRPLKNFVLKL